MAIIEDVLGGGSALLGVIAIPVIGIVIFGLYKIISTIYITYQSGKSAWRAAKERWVVSREQKREMREQRTAAGLRAQELATQQDMSLLQRKAALTNELVTYASGRFGGVTPMANQLRPLIQQQQRIFENEIRFEKQASGEIGQEMGEEQEEERLEDTMGRGEFKELQRLMPVLRKIGAGQLYSQLLQNYQRERGLIFRGRNMKAQLTQQERQDIINLGQISLQLTQIKNELKKQLRLLKDVERESRLGTQRAGSLVQEFHTSVIKERGFVQKLLYAEGVETSRRAQELGLERNKYGEELQELNLAAQMARQLQPLEQLRT